MRRAILAAASTVAALVLLLGFKTQPPPTAARQDGSAVAPGPAGSSPAPPAAGTAPTGSATASAAPQAVTVTGQSVSTRYGPVQVRVVATGTRVEDVTALTLPSEEARSVQISQRAAPALRQEALAAQSAEIDMVSGATFTSQGYQRSLQSALDQLPGS